MRPGLERRKRWAEVTAQRWEQLAETLSGSIPAAVADAADIQLGKPQMRRDSGNLPMREAAGIVLNNPALKATNQRHQRTIRGLGHRIGDRGSGLDVNPYTLRIAVIENLCDVK